MKIETAYLCVSCHEVFGPWAPHGSCPSCGSEQIRPLGWLVRKRRDHIRWLKKIGVKKSNAIAGA